MAWDGHGNASHPSKYKSMQVLDSGFESRTHSYVRVVVNRASSDLVIHI